MNALVVGGTSGLGLEIADKLSQQYHSSDVHLVGRHDPEEHWAYFHEFDLSEPDLPGRIGNLVMNLNSPVDTLVYAPGFYQEGRVDDLSDEDVDKMLDVGERGLILFVKKILEKQSRLDELITITSTSQWIPREKEPVYNAAKAGAGHFSNGIAEDERVGKVLVVGPAGMNTDFWDGIERDDIEEMMDPREVAWQIQHLRHGRFDKLPLHDTDKAKLVEDYRYCFAKILRKTGDLPQRVEIADIR